MAGCAIDGKEQISGVIPVADDLGEREAEVLKDFLGVVRLCLYVLAAIGGAGLSADHFGLI